jgi:hypothetical protein
MTNVQLAARPDRPERQGGLVSLNPVIANQETPNLPQNLKLLRVSGIAQKEILQWLIAGFPL